MLPELKGKGIFVFSDPGGAKPILSFIKQNEHIVDYLVISDRTYNFFSDFGIKVQNYKQDFEISIIDKFKPEFIFTGTSYTSKIELKFIQVAKQKVIPTYAFIDHYTAFSERFKLNDENIYPEYVCVIDEKAEKIALANKVNSTIIITGNYYHDFLHSWKPAISRDEFFNLLNIPIHNKLIIYAPDPLTNVGGTKVFGLDEITVWDELYSVLKKFSADHYTLVFKPHPNQKKNNIFKSIHNSGINHLIGDDLIHTNTLLFYSDAVIGMFSSILIESSFFNNYVIRCLIGLSGIDPFQDNKIGKVAYNNRQLEDLIRNIFTIKK